MAVTATRTIRAIPIQGGDPRRGEPAGIWAVSHTLTGDASGGNNTITFEFTVAGRVTGLIFSLEQVNINHGLDVAILEMEMFTSNFAWDPGISMFLSRLITLQPGVVGGRNMPLGRDMVDLRGLYLGQQLGSVSAASLVFRAANGDGIQNSVSVGGYFWDPQARRAPGGLRRGPGPFPI